MTRALLLLLAVTACAKPAAECQSKRATLMGRGVSTRIGGGYSPERFGFPWESCEVSNGQPLCWSKGMEIVESCLDELPDGGAK